MKLGIFSIYDKLVGYGKPFPEVSLSVANRNFANSVLEEFNGLDSSAMYDMSLYHLGDFDTETGIIESFESPIFVNSGVLVINTQVAEHI